MMNSVHPHISDVNAMFTLMENLWYWMTGHYGWLAHTFARHSHIRLWRHLAALLNNLDWLIAHWPSTCAALCGLS